MKKVPPPLIYMGAVGIQAATPLATAPLLTRSLSVQQFGILSAAVSLSAVLSIAFCLQLPAIISREVVSQPDSVAAASNRACLALAAILGIASSLALLIVVDAIWAIACLGAIPGAVAQTLLADSRARSRPWFFAVVLIGLSSFPAWVGTIAVTRLASVQTYLTTVLIVGVLGAAILIPRASIFWPKGAPRSLRRDIFLRGIALLPHALALALALTGMRFTVAWAGGPIQAAEYQVAYLIGGPPTVLMYALNNHYGVSIIAAPVSRLLRVCLHFALVGLGVTGVWLLVTQTLMAEILELFAPSFSQASVQTVCALITLQVLPLTTYLILISLCLRFRNTNFLSWVSPATVCFVLVLCFEFGSASFAGAAAGLGIFSVLTIALAVRLAWKRVSTSSTA